MRRWEQRLRAMDVVAHTENAMVTLRPLPLFTLDGLHAAPAPASICWHARCPPCLASNATTRSGWLSGDAQMGAGMAIKVGCKPHQE
jgi:hypothetical protein